jgi:S1-C subfamily serine protease
LSDEWFYYRSQRRSSGSSWTPLLVALLLIFNVGVVAYTTIHSNEQVQDLKDDISTLSTSVDILNAKVNDANSEISSLRAMLESGAVNVTVTPGASDTLLINLYNKTRDSVVLISVELTDGTATGSGFIYDTSGHIITNNHVVENAESITVTFIDGTIYSVDDVVGTDPYSDIAVIKITAPLSLLKPLKLGDSSALKVGESVVAIGNPYGLANTLTSGIISATGRQMDSTSNYPIVDVIQTDAAINPGNSGGPLLNMRGEVVGINTAIPTETSRGIGFAVPSNTILRELPSLLTYGMYNHPYLGITGVDLTPNLVAANSLPTGTHGTLVIEVATGGPSDAAHVRGSKISNVNGVDTYVGGDVILGTDGKQMKSFYDLIVYIQRNKVPGSKVILNILRGGSATDVEVTLGTRPPP